MVSRILLIGGTDRLLRKSAGLDLDVVHLRSAPTKASDRSTLPGVTYVDDLDDIAAITTVVGGWHTDAPIARIICHSEPLQMLAGHLTTTLGVDGNSFETVSKLRDKYALRQALRKTGDDPTVAAVVRSPTEAATFQQRHGAVVIKPRSGAGSLGISVVESQDEARAAWDRGAQLGLTEVLAEQRLVGTEVSLESFSVNGVHALLAATTKTLDANMVELGHAVPAPLTPAQLLDASRLMRAVLDAAGLRWGPAHTEVVLTDSGARLIESHSRRAGNHINELVSLVYGFDMERKAFEYAADPSLLPPTTLVADGGAAVRLLSAPPGTVSEVTGVEAARADPAVTEVELTLACGDHSRGLRWSGDYAGHVLTRAATAAAADRHAERVADTVAFVVAPQPAQDPDGGVASEVFDPFDAAVDDRALQHGAPGRLIGVVTGGVSEERDRSLLSGRTVFDALTAQGCAVRLIDAADPALVEQVREIDVAFLAIAGRYAEDGILQGFLETLRVPYTGSSVLASALGMNKPALKTFVAGLGVRVLDHVEIDPLAVDPDAIGAIVTRIGLPLMLKPVAEGGSVGMTLISAENELREALEGASETLPERFMAETYCVGRSITVGVVDDANGPRALPPLEAIADGAFYDYEIKRDPSRHRYECPAALPRNVASRLQAVAVQVHEALGCSGASRSDFMVTEDGTDYFLEINTLPGLSRTGNLATMALAADVSYDELIVRILKSASLKAHA